MSRAFDRATGWIVDRPSLVAILLAALTGLAILGYTAPHRLTNLFATEPEEESSQTDEPSEVYDEPPDVEPITLAESHAIVVVQSESLFTPTGARAMRRVVEALESLEHVKSILWMDRVPILNIFGLPEPLFPRSQASLARFEAAREKALAHPLVAGQLLSADGRTLLLLVNFDFLFVQSDDDCTIRLRQVAEEAAAEFPSVKFSFGVTGRVPMYVTAMHSHEVNQLRYQIVGYGMIALTAIVLFRGVAAVLVVAIAPSLGVFWTLGILRFFDLQDNPLNDVIMPVLISLVGLTDGVHLMVQIRRLRASGMSGHDAARAGVREVGLACGLTSLTTAIGFGSLQLAHHDIVRQFGWCCVAGVLLTFVAVVTSIPLACSTWLGRRVHIGHERGLIDQNLNRIGGLIEYVLARTKVFSVIGIIATVLLASACLTLRPDERNSNALPTRSEAAVALRQADKALGGLEFGYVRVNWSKNVASDSGEVLEVIGKVDDLLQQHDLIGHPLSIRNFIDALPGEGKPADRMSMLELLPPPLKRAFYVPELRRASVSFRVQDLGIAKYGSIFEQIESGLEQIALQHSEFTFRMSGSAVWRWRNLYRIVVDLAASLGTATLIIFVVLAIVYRSFRIGLISIVPNLFPLAFAGTYLVVTGQALELVSVCAFTICLGIAVDDSIHFLTRYYEEQRRSANQQEAIRRAFTGVGTALIMTTMVLVAGFSTVLFSDSRDHRIFASMGGLAITSALFADLVFLPALLSRFTAFDNRRNGTSTGRDYQ